MPNHVESELKVTGCAREIARFKKEVADSKDLLSADKIIPYPKKFKQMDAECPQGNEPDLQTKMEKYKAKYGTNNDGYNSGGYEWCKEHWGTKWGFYDVDLEIDKPKELMYTFNTAWSPAMPIMYVLVKKYPKLAFDYHYIDEGQAFEGFFVAAKGKVELDECKRPNCCEIEEE